MKDILKQYSKMCRASITDFNNIPYVNKNSCELIEIIAKVRMQKQTSVEHVQNVLNKL